MAILNYDVPDDTLNKLAELRLKTGKFQNKLLSEAVDILYARVALNEHVDRLKEQIVNLPDELKSVGSLFITILDALNI